MELAWAMCRQVADEGRTTFDYYAVIGPAGAVSFRTMDCDALPVMYGFDVVWHERGGDDGDCEWLGRCEVVRTELTHALRYDTEGRMSWLDTAIMGWEGLYERLEDAYRDEWGPPP